MTFTGDYEIDRGQFRTSATVRGHGGNDRLAGEDDRRRRSTPKS
jgi:hypothetical protein